MTTGFDMRCKVQSRMRTDIDAKTARKYRL